MARPDRQIAAIAAGECRAIARGSSRRPGEAPGRQRTRRGVALALCLAALCCGALLAPSPSMADVIAPGQKAIRYCFEVAGLAAYPEFVVLVLGVDPSLGPYGVVQPGACAGFYKLSSGALYAVRKAAFDPAAVPAEASKQAAYFNAQPRFLRAPVRLHPLTTVDQRDSRAALVDIVEIVALADRGLDARLARVRYTYTDGTSEELAVAADGARPAPRAVADTRARAILLWGLLVPALALAGLITFFLIRHRRR